MRLRGFSGTIFVRILGRPRDDSTGMEPRVSYMHRQLTLRTFESSLRDTAYRALDWNLHDRPRAER